MGLLVRVGADQSYGKVNSPIKVATGEFVYVPIPERADRVKGERGRPYTEIVERVRMLVGNNDVSRYVPMDLWMHLDPDFEHLTYGNNPNGKGAAIGRLAKGDFIAFYASLRAVDKPATLVYALIGLLTLERIILAKDVPAREWYVNAHTRRSPVSPEDVVVIASPEASGRLDRAIAIGEYRDRAYRVRRDLLDAWGGLSVRDGYIQRSAVPPRFNDPLRFLSWFRRQEPDLVRAN